MEKSTKASEREQLKSGRGSQRQAIVATMAESTILEDYKQGKRIKAAGISK